LPQGEYLIGPQDLLEIQVFGVEELYRKVRVNSRGSISLPLIGTIQAAGSTAEQLEARLAAELSKNYLQDPQVSVFIEEFTNLRVTVEGAVKKPGIFPLQGQTTLLQSIALAEGPDRLASSVVKVFRIQGGGARQSLQFDLDEIRDGTIPDPLLKGDDIVVVETSTGKSVLHGVTDTLRGFVRPFGF
jgi:polysaccharide export outer membrane protein